jgi:pre-mRNA-splicing factor CWC22
MMKVRQDIHMRFLFLLIVLIVVDTKRMAAVELEKSEKSKDVVAVQTDAQAEFVKLIGSRSGGLYMPPARLRALEATASNDKASPEYQRLSWMR